MIHCTFEHVHVRMSVSVVLAKVRQGESVLPAAAFCELCRATSWLVRYSHLLTAIVQQCIYLTSSL